MPREGITKKKKLSPKGIKFYELHWYLRKRKTKYWGGAEN
jgi:hypothetical protein